LISIKPLRGFCPSNHPYHHFRKLESAISNMRIPHYDPKLDDLFACMQLRERWMAW
jgi:hypothetical protein